MEKIRIEEVIVVEGRDDTTAVQAAVDCTTIETHGFGIRKETWALIEKAYKEKGIIVFTDPDYSGEEIRRKLNARFPNAKQAFLSQKTATKDGDIGVENAVPADIIEALQKSHFTHRDARDRFTEEDLFLAGLTGTPESKQRREQLGELLGIGYGNSKQFLKKLNAFDITEEQFGQKLKELQR